MWCFDYLPPLLVFSLAAGWGIVVSTQILQLEWGRDSTLLFSLYATLHMLIRKDRWDVVFCVCFVFKRDHDVITGFYLSWDLMKGCSFLWQSSGAQKWSCGFALERLLKEITQSPHLCCIMGQTERSWTVDIPIRCHSDYL